MDKKEDIFQLTCGIFFKHSFSLLDKWGTIADDILYKNDLFSAEFFPNISTQYTTERVLSNRELGHQLRLNQSNLVFTQKILEGEDFENAFDSFSKRIEDYLVPKIIAFYDLRVIRIGFVYYCTLDASEIDTFTSRFLKPDANGISNLRFSMKEITLKGLITKEHNDFINKIYNIGDMNSKMTGIAYDYQHHYNPPRREIRDLIKPDLTNSLKDFEKDVLVQFGD